MSEKDITAGYDSEALVYFQPKYFARQFKTKINSAELRFFRISMFDGHVIELTVLKVKARVLNKIYTVLSPGSGYITCCMLHTACYMLHVKIFSWPSNKFCSNHQNRQALHNNSILKLMLGEIQ